MANCALSALVVLLFITSTGQNLNWKGVWEGACLSTATLALHQLSRDEAQRKERSGPSWEEQCKHRLVLPLPCHLRGALLLPCADGELTVLIKLLFQ